MVDSVGRAFEDSGRRDTIDDGICEPRWHFRRGDEGVVCCELGRDGLQAAVGEGDPAVCGYLL